MVQMFSQRRLDGTLDLHNNFGISSPDDEADHSLSATPNVLKGFEPMLLVIETCVLEAVWKPFTHL